MIQNAVSKSYDEEKLRAKLPNYVCRYDEYDAGDYEDVPTGYGQFVKSHGPHDQTEKSTHLAPARMPVKVPA